MLFFVGTFGYLFLNFNLIKNNPVSTNTNSDTNFFSDVKLVAKSAFVEDANTGEIIYSKSENKILPIASITKVMTAMVAYDTLDGDDYIQINTDSIKTNGNYGFEVNEEFKAKDLILFMLIGSANDAAVAIGDEVEAKLNISNFVDKMNQKSRDLKLINTYYYNSSGLDREEYVGSYSTAKDIATLFSYAYKNYEIIKDTNQENISINSKAGILHEIENTNELLKEKDYKDKILASKTGYTDNAGGNLVVIARAKNNKLYTIVVLGSTIDDRFVDMGKLIDRLDNLK